MSRADRTTLIEQVLEYQRMFMGYAFKNDSAAYWTQLDLTMGQLRALVAVACTGPLPIGLLGAALGIGKPAATLMVNALVRHDLVVRHEDPTDRRRTLVQISDRGQELLEELIRGRQELFTEWMHQLPDADLTALAQGLRAIVRVVAATEQEKYP